MDALDGAVSVLDYALNTARKRHIVGGILLSISMLFGGLALTVMTIGKEEPRKEEKKEEEDEQDI